jgi:hypothetical protein
MEENVNISRKKISTLAAIALVAGSLIAGTSAAHAAVAKANGACAKAGTKTTIAKVVYTCGVSPIATNKANTWVSANCLSASTAYKTAAAQQAAFVASAQNALKKLQTSIDSYTAVQALYQVAIDDYQKRISNPTAFTPKANPVTAQAGLTATQAQLARIVTATNRLKSMLETQKANQSTLLGMGADNVKQVKDELNQICKSGL